MGKVSLLFNCWRLLKRIDETKSICKLYGVWGKKKFMGREYEGVHRTTFIINSEGKIEKIITKVDTKNHTKQIL